MLLTILIPCLNEEKTITRAVKTAYEVLQINEVSSFEIIVADNGSTDKSIKKILQQGIARIVSVSTKGYGAALHYGIGESKGKYVLFADADLSYDFKEIPKFLPYLKNKTDVDLVLGSRFLGKIDPGAMPALHRYIGTPFLTFLINSFYSFSTSDCNSGMRMVRKNFYLSLKMKNAGMEWASELLIKSALAKAKYVELPISLHKDKRGRKPHLLSWSDGWRHLKAIILLKPTTLFFVTGFFILVACFFFYLNLIASIFFFLTAITMFFCSLAAILIKDSVLNKESDASQFILQLPLVSITSFVFFLAFFQLFIFPDRYIILKTILVSITLIFCIWVFFIETVKTHLINKLP